MRADDKPLGRDSGDTLELTGWPVTSNGLLYGDNPASAEGILNTDMNLAGRIEGNRLGCREKRVRGHHDTLRSSDCPEDDRRTIRSRDPSLAG